MQAERYRTAPPITRYSILGDRYLSIIPIDSDVTPPKFNQTPENRGDDRVIGQNGDRTANKARPVVVILASVIRVEQEGRTSSDPRVRNSRQARDPLNLELRFHLVRFPFWLNGNHNLADDVGARWGLLPSSSTTGTGNNESIIRTQGVLFVRYKGTICWYRIYDELYRWLCANDLI